MNNKATIFFADDSDYHPQNFDPDNNKHTTIRERPKITYGYTARYKTACCSLYFTVNHDERDLIEVFSNLGKTGGCTAQSEAIGRLVSLCLRNNVDPLEIERQLKGIRCSAVLNSKVKDKPIDALSCPDAVARAISKSTRKKQECRSENC